MWNLISTLHYDQQCDGSEPAAPCRWRGSNRRPLLLAETRNGWNLATCPPLARGLDDLNSQVGKASCLSMARQR